MVFKKGNTYGRTNKGRKMPHVVLSNKLRVGEKRTEEQKMKMSIVQKEVTKRKNYIPGFKGKHHTPKTNKRIHKKGEESHRWLGDDVGYSGVHKHVRYNKPKTELCEICKKVPPIDISNISGIYTRDINDYEWLCRKCHQIKDGRLNNRDEKGRFIAGDKNFMG